MDNNRLEKQNRSELKVSEWSAFIHARCPRCRMGSIFTGAMYGFKIQKMKEVCEVCDLRFEREPGYFYVSMFVSYAMNVAEIIFLGVAAYVLGLDIIYENLWYFVAIIFVGVLIFSPFNYRYSRLVLLYWLSPGLHYDPSRIKKKSNIEA